MIRTRAFYYARRFSHGRSMNFGGGIAERLGSKTDIIFERKVQRPRRWREIK